MSNDNQQQQQHRDLFRVRLSKILGLGPVDVKLAKALHRLNMHFPLDGSKAEKYDETYSVLKRWVARDSALKIWSAASRAKTVTWLWLQEVQGYQLTMHELCAYSCGIDACKDYSKGADVTDLVREFLRDDEVVEAVLDRDTAS